MRINAYQINLTTGNYSILHDTAELMAGYTQVNSRQELDDELANFPPPNSPEWKAFGVGLMGDPSVAIMRNASTANSDEINVAAILTAAGPSDQGTVDLLIASWNSIVDSAAANSWTGQLAVQTAVSALIATHNIPLSIGGDAHLASA